MGRSCVFEIAPGTFDFLTDYYPSSRRTYFKRARVVLEAAGRTTTTCERCNYHGNQTHVHHIDKDITNSRSDNLLVLCFKCHKAEHPDRLNFSYEEIYAPLNDFSTLAYL